MDAGGNSDVLVGIDTVAIGGVATAPLFPARRLKLLKSGVLFLRCERGGISLFVSVRNGRWTFRLQCSLPRIVHGNNYLTIPFHQLPNALTVFVTEARHHFPELRDIPLEVLPVRRVDIAFDLPVHATPRLIQALRDCYCSNRNMPGFVYKGKKPNSFYSKDTRGKRPPTYRSLIGYGKRYLADGQKGLRLESRFHTSFLTRKFGQGFSLPQFASKGVELLRPGWKYIDELFEFLAPHDDASLQSAVRNAPEKQRDFLESFGYLAREVPLDKVKIIFFGNNGVDLRTLRKYGVGFGDAEVPELRKFAEIRREWSLRFSCPYQNYVTDDLTQGVTQHLERINLEDAGDVDQLDHGGAPVAPLDLANRHGMPAEFGGELPLRKSPFGANPRDRFSQAIFLKVERLTSMLTWHFPEPDGYSDHIL